MDQIFRFAPSPTGRLHLGNARTAIFNAAAAKAASGRFVLRYDDTDAERSTEAFAQGIANDLAWLGIEPDVVVRQSERATLHDAALERLKAAGLIYACYETPDELDRKRKRLAARNLPPVYDRAALKLTDEEREAFEAEGRRPHSRFLLPNHDGDPFAPHRTEVRWDDAVLGEQVVDLASLSDPVLVREDGTYLYTLPSVVDDADLGITTVLRGADHVTNTGVQIALFEALGQEVPRFGHHNLLLDASGDGLSKRLGSLALAQLREDGFEPEAVIGVAALTGTSRPLRPVPLSELAEGFDPAVSSASPARLLEDALAGLNRDVVHAIPYARAQSRLTAIDADIGETFWLAVRDNLDRVEDAARWARIIRGGGDVHDAGDDRAFLDRAAEALPQTLDADAWPSWTASLKAATDRKGRALFMPLRLALTGLDHGPELGDLLPLMDREMVLRRLRGQSAK